MYDGAVAVWQQLRADLELCLRLCGVVSKDVWKLYWSSSQRFFKLLCISAKVGRVRCGAQGGWVFRVWGRGGWWFGASIIAQGEEGGGGTD